MIMDTVESFVPVLVPKMDQKIKTQWVHALRSGVYRQGTGKLRRENGTHCCLGVLCDIIGGWDEQHSLIGVLSPRNEDAAGFKNFDTFKLAIMNDIHGKSFDEIAQYIEENL